MRLVTINLDIVVVDMNVSAFPLPFMTGQERHAGANIIHLGFPFFLVGSTMTLLSMAIRRFVPD
jgi:hypothetical protein